MTDEKLIEKLSELIRTSERTFVVDDNHCVRYPMNLLRKMFITSALHADQELLEDAWYLLISGQPHVDPVGPVGCNGDSYADLISKSWLEYIKEDREKACPFKDGDIIISYSGVSSVLGVFKRQGVSRHQAKVYFTVHEKYFILPEDGERDMWLEDDARLANEEEKKRMEDILARDGYRWNTEKKELEEIPRWRAELLERYWMVDHIGRVDAIKEHNTTYDRNNWEAGNYFRTPEAAMAVAEQVREIFQRSKGG